MRREKWFLIASILVVLTMVLTTVGCGAAATATPAPVGTEAPVATTAPATTEAPAATQASATEAPAAAGGVAKPLACPAEKVTLDFWSWNNEGAYPKVHEDAVNRYTKDCPNVTIKREYISYSDYITKLKAAIAAGNPPDVFQMFWSGEYHDMAKSGELLPLKDKMDGFPKLYDNVIQQITYNGDFYTLPMDLNTLQVAYNKKLFDEMGISIPKTQDELIEASKKFLDKGIFPLALGTKDLWAAHDLFAAEVVYTDAAHTKFADADAGKVAWDDPAFLAGAQAARKLVDAKVFAPGPSSMEVFVGAENLFVNGQAAMFYPVGNFVTGGLTEKIAGAFEYSLFPLPPLKADQEAMPTGGAAEMFSLPTKGKNNAVALDFLRYLFDDNGRKALVLNDFIPSSQTEIPAEKASDPLYKNMNDAQAKAQTRVIFTGPVYTQSMNGMQALIDGKMSPADFVKSLVDSGKGVAPEGTAPAAAGGVAKPLACPAEKVTLDFWSWNNEGAYPKVHEDAVNRYTKDCPNVTIKREYISYSDYITKLKAAIAAGNPPDVFQMFWSGEYHDMAKSGELLPLKDKMDGFPKLYDNVIQQITYNGDFYTLPMDLNTLQVAYNKKLFDEMGISIPKTQDELIEASKKFLDKGIFPLALGTKDLWAAHDLFAAEVVYTDAAHTKFADADAGKVAWDDPAFLAGAQAARKLVDAKVFAPGPSSMEVFVGAENLFVNGQAAMFYPVGNFVTGGLTEKIAGAFEYSLFPLPPLKADQEAMPTGGAAEMFSLPTKGKNNAVALDFLRYLFDDNGRKALVLNDFIPSSQTEIPAEKASDPLYKNMNDAQAKAQTRVIFTGPVYTQSMNGMQALIDGKMSPADFVKSLVDAAKK